MYPEQIKEWSVAVRPRLRSRATIALFPLVTLRAGKGSSLAARMAAQRATPSPASNPRGIVGPPLGGLARRPFIAGQLPNTPGALVAFLVNPPALVAGIGMPNVGLTIEDARDVAAYLYTLPAKSER
jgi:hypothetical protein